MPNSRAKLRRHLHGQHNEQKADFLKFDELPIDCRFTNFKKYLVDPTIELTPSDNGKIRRGPRQAKALVKRDD